MKTPKRGSIKRASMQLPADLVQWLKMEAARQGVPMYALVERKFKREREKAWFAQSVKAIDPCDKKAVAAWNKAAGISRRKP